MVRRIPSKNKKYFLRNDEKAFTTTLITASNITANTASTPTKAKTKYIQCNRLDKVSIYINHNQIIVTTSCHQNIREEITKTFGRNRTSGSANENCNNGNPKDMTHKIILITALCQNIDEIMTKLDANGNDFNHSIIQVPIRDDNSQLTKKTREKRER